MNIPDGYEGKNKVCKLKKALYGLKQAPMLWNKTFKSFLKLQGLYQLNTEQCIFKSKSNELILAIYVDDGIIIGKSEKEINNLLLKLKQEYEIVIYDDTKTFVELTNNKLITQIK